MQDIRYNYLLRLGDDSLVLGQRLSEWCGHAPTIEVDLSLANIALDLIGQATLLLGYAGEIKNGNCDADHLAFHRDALQFRNCLLAEQPNGDFAQTMARQFLFSTWQQLLFEALAADGDARLAEIAAKAVKETIYHADFATEWVIRLGDGTEESHHRMAEGFDWMWRFVDELFDMDDLERAAVQAGFGIDKARLRPAFDAKLASVLTKATLDLPVWPRPVTGGRRGHHSEHLGHLLAVMQHIPRAYPNAKW